MSSPFPNQQPPQGWASQRHQQPSIQKPDDRNSYGYYAPIIQPYHTQYAPQQPPYIQPYYGDAQPAPFIAELPAPSPPAPPTTTPNEQLKEDQLLASKLQQLDVAEVRSRSNSAVSQRQRPMSTAVPRLDNHSPLVHQASSLSLRPYSTNTSVNDAPWSPGSYGTQRNVPSPSLLPEVVPEVRRSSYDPAHDLPIPVEVDRRSSSFSQPALPDSTSLPRYLETHRQVPYPPTWRLPPVIATFYAYAGSKIDPKADWLSQQESFTWRTIRPTEHAYNPSAPSYTFKFTTKGGSFRDPRFSWVMTLPDPPSDPKKKVAKIKQGSWAYDLRLDLNGGMRKKEVLNHGSSKTAILTTYVHARNYDSLRFIGPDGRAYMWVSSSQVSSVNGFRYDTVRHALFGAVGQIKDPLYGEIVADHTFWDGYVDENEVHMGVKCDGCQKTPIRGLRWKCKVCHQHDVCGTCRQSIITGGFGAQMQQACKFSLVCLPDEALCIRSPYVDPALVVATLQILKDWEKHTLRDEKRGNAKGFQTSEEAARQHDLGIMSYWSASDWDKKDKKNIANAKMGTVVKADNITAAFEGTSSALGNLVDAGFALAGHGTVGSGHVNSHGGDGGGGGGDGGGGGGGSGGGS
jgi:hypothetical protein